MSDKNRTKGLITKKLENSEYQKRHNERYPAFKLEAQILVALERKGWSYADLAKVANTYKSNISRDLRAGGILTASLARINKIADALGMKLITLLIPKNAEDFIVPKIEELVRVAFGSESQGSQNDLTLKPIAVPLPNADENVNVQWLPQKQSPIVYA